MGKEEFIYIGAKAAFQDIKKALAITEVTLVETLEIMNEDGENFTFVFQKDFTVTIEFYKIQSYYLSVYIKIFTYNVYFTDHICTRKKFLAPRFFNSFQRWNRHDVP